MSKTDSQLKIINVIDPMMCLQCRSAHIAEVLFTDGETRKMFYCSRLDCDNWSSVQVKQEHKGQGRLNLEDTSEEAA